MKKLFFILVIIVVAASCSVQNDKSEANLALVEKYVDAVENLDYSFMETALDDNYMGYGPSHTDSIGKELAIANWKNNIENLYKSVTYNKSRNLANFISEGPNAGEWVSNWAELNIVFKEDEKKVTIWANTIYKIENNKIVKSYTFYNEADVLEQLGYVFINPNDL